MSVTLVAAVAGNGVIGADGGIPWRVPGEQTTFKRLTMGHVLVMGRRTYESIGRPLPGRTTVVVTRSPEWSGAPGVLVCAGVDEALRKAATIDPEVYVAGGAQVYREALPYADRLALTRIDAEPEGDTYFPDVDWDQWREVSREPHDGFTVVTYERASPG
ncbi:MAG: dihydrofolate reductase [Streptosporangiales bacterium]